MSGSAAPGTPPPPAIATVYQDSQPQLELMPWRSPTPLPLQNSTTTSLLPLYISRAPGIPWRNRNPAWPAQPSTGSNNQFDNGQVHAGTEKCQRWPHTGRFCHVSRRPARNRVFQLSPARLPRTAKLSSTMARFTPARKNAKDCHKLNAFAMCPEGLLGIWFSSFARAGLHGQQN